MSHANIHDVPIILKGLSGGSDIEIEWMNQRSVQFDITEPKNHNCIDVHSCESISSDGVGKPTIQISVLGCR